MSTTPAAGAVSPVCEFRTKTVACLCDVSVRQLQWWRERGIVLPVVRPGMGGGGTVVFYPFTEALAIAVLADLRRRGLPLQRLAWLPQFLRRPGPRWMLAHDRALYLITDGRNAIFATSAELVLRAYVRARAGLYLVDVGQYAQRLREAGE